MIFSILSYLESFSKYTQLSIFYNISTLLCLSYFIYFIKFKNNTSNIKINNNIEIINDSDDDEEINNFINEAFSRPIINNNELINELINESEKELNNELKDESINESENELNNELEEELINELENKIIKDLHNNEILNKLHNKIDVNEILRKMLDFLD
jgi:hypothetical protein